MNCRFAVNVDAHKKGEGVQLEEERGNVLGENLFVV